MPAREPTPPPSSPKPAPPRLKPPARVGKARRRKPAASVAPPGFFVSPAERMAQIARIAEKLSQQDPPTP